MANLNIEQIKKEFIENLTKSIDEEKKDLRESKMTHFQGLNFTTRDGLVQHFDNIAGFELVTIYDKYDIDDAQQDEVYEDLMCLDNCGMDIVNDAADELYHDEFWNDEDENEIIAAQAEL